MHHPFNAFSKRIALSLCLLPVICGVIRAQEEGTTSGGTTDNPNLRTRSRTKGCSFGVEFGVRFIGPGVDPDTAPSVPFAAMPQGVKVETDGRIALVVKNIEAQPPGGKLSFFFYRGIAGDQPINDPGYIDLNSVVGKQAPLIDAPASVSPSNKEEAEVFRIKATYQPTDPTIACLPVTDTVVVTWTWNGHPSATGDWHFEELNPEIKELAKKKGHILIPKEQSRVKLCDKVIDEKQGNPGHTNKATQTTIFFAVHNSFGCCDIAGRAYAVIQFVRHAWRLGNNPPNSDDWNLDGPNSQSERHEQNPNLPYDPTYTDDPAHGGDPSGKSNTYVQAGPWDPAGSSQAIQVTDYPGLLEPEHSRFVKEGGAFTWEFLTLLVCQESPASAEQYLKSGLVCAKQHYKIQREYTAGSKEPPKVALVDIKDWGKLGKPDAFKKCVPLATLLDQMDLKKPFLNPRPHVIKLP